ncbi:MAG: roadblock/LC7 domain-containing protein [Acinetobacter sp.]|nr:roadblock/LC7 domain-containing protein [Acinetobacter sp.]
MFNGSATNQRKAPDALVDFGKKCIGSLLNDVKGIHFVMLGTTDGFELASVHKNTLPNSGKLAAVSSSILAMVTAFMGEIQLSGCQTITLEAEDGKAILTAIAAQKYHMILVTITQKDVLIGQLLHEIKRIEKDIITASQSL